MIARRRDELEGRLSTLEAEYEELLGASKQPQTPFLSSPHYRTEKTIHDEETSNADIANSMAEFKVRLLDNLHRINTCSRYNCPTLEQTGSSVRRSAGSQHC